MTKRVELFSQIQEKILGENDELKIVGYASTKDKDRAGDVIIPEAWKSGGLDNYLVNPILLFNHKYDKPIGRVIELEVDDVGLKITAVISKGSGNVYQLIRDGVLTTFSVGFLAKEVDYDDATDIFVIKLAELLEVSVVSVPCNQAAVFSLSKSLSAEELTKYKTETNVVKTTETHEVENTNTMTPEEIAALAQEAAVKAIKASEEAKVKAAEAAAAKAADDKAVLEKAAVAASAVVESREEALMKAFEDKLKTNNEDLQKTVDEFKTQLEEKSAELLAMQTSKRNFSERGGAADWSKDASLVAEAEDAYVLSRVLGKKSLEDTQLGKSLMEKVNLHSSVNVGSANLERTVSTNIERDIWNGLVLAPLFREIQMNSAQMTIPILPDAGYAEITSAYTGAGSQPNGDLDQRGATFGSPYDGVALGEKILSTVKMISKTYLGNETEEDAILPILPLIRESMARSHARGVENMLLAGNSTSGVYTSGAANGLIKFAESGSRTIDTATGPTDVVTSLSLFAMRKAMGKYGVKPQDVVYIVSEKAYFELIEDPEFADLDLVGSQANKLTGEVGRIYGSSVLLCDEFKAPAAGSFTALAVNRRNFVVPRLRGMTVESDYQVENQRQVLVTSQRLGFDELITGAKSVIGLRYKA